MKESEVQIGESTLTVSRPSVSAAGSRGAFSCRRWRLLTGTSSKSDEALNAEALTHQTSSNAGTFANVRAPTASAVSTTDWATTATPFAAFLTRDTVIPNTSRKSMAHAVLTSTCPPETVKKWDREIAICEHKHVQAMGRMTKKIYRGKGTRENSSAPAKRQADHEKQTLKDRIYLPALSQSRVGRLRGLSPRTPKLREQTPRSEKPPQNILVTFALPDALAGMKLLSSQLDELRAGLENATRARGLSASIEQQGRLWSPRLPYSDMIAPSRDIQMPDFTRRKTEQPKTTDSNSSSLETILLRVLEGPAACSDEYEADQEESTAASSETLNSKALDREDDGCNEDDMLLLLNTLDSAAQETSKVSLEPAATENTAIWTNILMKAEGRDARSYVQPTALPDDRHSSAAVDRKKEPVSAYAHYQKLAHDFDSLEREMQSHELTQRELEAQLEHAQAKIRASKAEEQQVEKDQWEHERDRQLEIFVQQRSALDAIRAQTESLDAEELRLQAEMEVIRERQQEVSETEAQHIRRLVHERTSLLEEELAKGKMDLDYIARVISTTRHQELKQGTQREAHKATSSSVQSLVQDVQERRRREFDGSEANFRERMQTFQLEKEALAKKAKALRVTKQRALQILSQNQQFAIKEYFDTTPPAQPRETNEKSIPSLDFGEILQSLNQSGAYVEQVQNLDSERNSGRRELADGLKDARLTIEQGPGRIKAIQKHLANRKEEAQKLGIVVELIGSDSIEYDGAWGIESYSPRQYELVYFLHGLLFSWMDDAVAEVSAQPSKELLELELKQWQTTHSNVEYEHDRESVQCHAWQILTSLVNEAITEIAEDIRSEFEANALRVRKVFSSAFRSVLFASADEKLGPPEKRLSSMTKAPLSATQAPLRWSLFESSLAHLRTRRRRENDSKSTGFLHQCTQPVIQGWTTTSLVLSPKKIPVKKIFGIFSVPLKHSDGIPTVNGLSNKPQNTSFAVSGQDRTETITFLSPAAPTSLSSTARHATTFWKNEPHLRLRQIATPSSVGCCSSLQLSPSGDLLVCGTTDGELVLWDLLPDQPVMLRVWSPPKAQHSRVTRVSLSANAQVVTAFFRRKTVCVFAVNPQTKANPQIKSKPAMHFENCFPIDPTKFQPHNLHLLAELSASNILAEPSFTPDFKERVPSAVAKATSAGWSPAELSFASCFQSFSLIGLATSDMNVLCGTTTGDLLKYNLQPQRKSNEIQPNGIQAAFDAPGPDSDSLSTITVRREFFRGHRRAILFASCLHRKVENGVTSKPTEILSVDQDDVICLWEYSAASFTGFGWFEPALKLRLELVCSSSDLIIPSTTFQTPNENQLSSRRSPLPPDTPAPTTLKGEMLQIALTPDDTRLVCMVFYADPTRKEVAGTLRFLQLLTGPMLLDPVRLNVAFTGGSGSPRFALTTSFLLVLANNRVQVYTLRTGKEAREPIVLSSHGQQQIVFNSITSTASSRRTNLDSTSRPESRRKQVTTTITFVVASDQHPRLLVHSFTASTPKERRNSEMNTNASNAH